MKQIFLWVFVLMAMSTSFAFAEVSLPDGSDTKTAPDFRLKTFSSCTDMKQEVSDFIETYFSNTKNGYFPYPTPLVRDAVWVPPTGWVATPVSNEVKNSISSSDAGGKISNAPYSETNTRTLWVDEADRVKTDGTYLYYVNEAKKRIEIMTSEEQPKEVNTILIPDSYYGVQIFLEKGKLIVVGTRSLNRTYSPYFWIDRNSRTVAIIYDVSDLGNIQLDRYFEIDGYAWESRLTNGQLTLLSTTNFSFPYERYLPVTTGTKPSLDSKKFANDFSFAKIALKKVDIARPGRSSSSLAKARFLPESNVASCSNISYVLPDTKTLENYSFTPTFTSITTLNIFQPKSKATTKVLFGDVWHMYVTANNTLYLSSTLYTSSNSACPPGAMCLMRWIEPGSSTIVHKFDLSEKITRYNGTFLIPGSLISDFAIDEKENGILQTVTQKTGTTSSNLLSIFSSTGSLLGTLSNIAPGERFQSVRFIGDRAYLVTFKQIDPLFVLDTKDAKNPKILGELKIPGYSTYLHPYDATHLIGIGYDTVSNSWGGTQNGGLKVDLYDVSDVAKPVQNATYTLWWAGSSSEALTNHRLFTWHKGKNLLLLPATLYAPYDTKNLYRYKDVFQWVIWISILPWKITETGRITGINISNEELTKLRDADCKKYTLQTVATPLCHAIIGGGEYCESSSYTYVPSYCYADSTLEEYKANILWNYSESFIDRVAYIGDSLFAFSPAKVLRSTLPNLTNISSLEFGK